MVDAGETENGLPVPTKVPPQLPEYHRQVAPVPSEPPETLRFVELPAQIGFTDAVALVGFVDSVLTAIATLTHKVVLHVPSARTK